MTVHPVLIRIPFVPGLAGPERIARQRRFARLALEHCARLAGAPPGDWPVSAERVPMPRDGFHWSIAHKPRFAAAVIAPRPVGIDIEAIIPRGRDLSPAVASEDEWSVLFGGHRGQSDIKKRQPVAWPVFFVMWTAKEATLKANSKGIGGLKECRLVRVDPSGRLVLSYANCEFAVQHLTYANHIAACTCDGATLHWHVIEAPAEPKAPTSQL